MDSTETIITLVGSEPGPSVIIMAGVHGEERAGVLALQRVLPKLRITRGTLFVAFANPRAIKRGVRFTEKNLNRCFFAGNQGKTYEDRRARQLMRVFDRCDALLDLHAYASESTGKAHTICEANSLNVAALIDSPRIVTKWNDIQPLGSDGYMWLSGRIGLGVELGPVAQTAEFVPVGVRIIYQFLQYFGLIPMTVPYSTSRKEYYAVRHGIDRTSKDYQLDASLKTFQKLQPGQVFGQQDGVPFVAESGDYIIFPRPNATIGSQAFLLAKRSAPTG